MNAFDIAVIVIVAFCLIRGLFKGLIGEVSGIVGVVAGFYGAITYYPLVSVYTEAWIQTPELRHIASVFILFCAILMFVSLIALMIRKFLHLVFLGWVDRTFGLVFGAAKGILIVCVLFIMMTAFLPKSSTFLKESFLGPHVAEASKALTVLVSKTARHELVRKLERII